MSTFYISDPANLEAYLWYFFEDDPATTHRFAFEIIEGTASLVRYDTDIQGEFVSGAIQFFGAGDAVHGVGPATAVEGVTQKLIGQKRQVVVSRPALPTMT